MVYFRALLAVLLGFVLGCSALYIALRLGLMVGAVILAAFGWALISSLTALFGASRPDGPQQACYLSLASAMSFGCGTVMSSALAAVLMHDAQSYPLWALTVWTAGICGLGVCLAVPFRDRLLAQLPFPSGQVAADTVKSLESGASTKPFVLSGLATLGWVALRDGLGLIPTRLTLHKPLLAMENAPMFLALGGLIGRRTCFSMLLGALIWFHILPAVTGPSTEQNILWFALGLMTMEGVLILIAILGKRDQNQAGPQSLNKLPLKALAVCLFLITIGHLSAFGGDLFLLTIPPLALIFCVISARVAGETDMVPTGVLGKLSLLFYGLLGGKAGANLALTGVLTGSAAAATDFTTDLRLGKELGCPPHRQFRWQLTGALLGAIVFVPLVLIIAENNPLGGETLPAPAARIWLELALLIESGGQSGITGFLLGLPLGLLLHKLSDHYAWTPSGPALAMAAFLDWPTCTALALGAWLFPHLNPKHRQSAASACIAAESSAGLLSLL